MSSDKLANSEGVTDASHANDVWTMLQSDAFERVLGQALGEQEKPIWSALKESVGGDYFRWRVAPMVQPKGLIHSVAIKCVSFYVLRIMVSKKPVSQAQVVLFVWPLPHS